VLREHTADVAVEAEAVSLGGLQSGRRRDGGGERFELSVTAENREAFLFDCLDELIYGRDSRGVLPVDNEAEVTEVDDEWLLTGSAREVPLESVDARDPEAVTDSEMDLSPSTDGWHASVV
jgi:SHS2 domain-containing protein